MLLCAVLAGAAGTRPLQAIATDPDSTETGTGPPSPPISWSLAYAADALRASGAGDHRGLPQLALLGLDRSGKHLSVLPDLPYIHDPGFASGDHARVAGHRIALGVES